KTHFLLLHAGENVIAGAVEDAVDALQRVAGKPFADGLHDGNCTAERRFEIERDVLFFRHGGLARTPPPADQLDEDVYFPVGGERYGIGNPPQALDLRISALAAGARGHRDHLDSSPTPGGERFALALEQPHDL